MRYLKTNTATVITVGPFYDVTDAITPEVALTATNEKLTFIVDNLGTPVIAVDANATASGGSNDFVHITGDDGGYYTLELTAANTNALGGAVLSITYATDHLPVSHEFMILPANVYDAMVGGSDKLQVDAVEISSATSTADNLETAYASTLAEETAVPAANAPLWTKQNFQFAKARNKITQTATTQVVRNDADSAAIATSTVSDDGTTYVRGEYV